MTVECNARKRYKRLPRISGRRLMEIRRRHFEKFPLCVRCMNKSRVTLAVHLDHIVPIEKGGPDTEENRQGLCIPCHKEKTLEDFNMQSHKDTGTNELGFPLDPGHHWNRGAA